MTVRYSITGTGAESIAASVEEGISEGALAPGDALPSIREVAAELGVNANTVAAAYRLLRDRGAIETAGRRGTRVRDRAGNDAALTARPRKCPRGRATCRPATRIPRCCPSPRSQFALDNPSEPLLYGRSAMSAELVEHACADLSADGVPTDHLAVTSGALDGIERVLTAHLRPGDRVAVEDPGWANLLDLIAALGLSPNLSGSTTRGRWCSAWRGRCVAACALWCRPRAQNPTGAALSKERAAALRSLLAGKTTDVLVIEDDHCAGISGASVYPLAGATRRWAFVRSASKAYGPDLRLAVLAGDRRTVERVHGRLRLGPGWVSRLLQDLAVCLWSDVAATDMVGAAEVRYAKSRNALRDALAKRDVAAHARSGLNVWIPVPDETVAITRLLSAGWAAAPGTRFRMDTPPGMRITIADLTDDEIEPLADAIAEAIHGTGRSSV